MVVGEVIAGGLTMLQPITVYQVVTEPSETTTITDVLLGIAAVVVSLVVNTRLGYLTANIPKALLLPW